MKKELRKQQDSLVITGTGVCFFGLWGVISTVMRLVLNRTQIIEALNENELGWLAPFLYILLLACAAAVFSAHFFVGMSARSEGLGKKRHFVYIFAAVLMLVFSMLVTISDIANFNSEQTDIFDFVVALIMSATFIATLVQMIIASIRTKILRKSLKEQEGE